MVTRAKYLIAVLIFSSLITNGGSLFVLLGVHLFFIAVPQTYPVLFAESRTKEHSDLHFCILTIIESGAFLVGLEHAPAVSAGHSLRRLHLWAAASVPAWAIQPPSWPACLGTSAFAQ